MVNGLSAAGSFYGSSQIGAHGINGGMLPSVMSRVGYNKGNSNFEIGLGLGGVTTLAAKASSELRWDKMGLELSLKGERNKKLFRDSAKLEVALPEAGAVSMLSKYRQSDVRVGLGAEATYRPIERVKLGLGVEAGVVMNTTPNVDLDVFYGNEKYSVSTKQNHIPEGYVTPKVSYEIDLLKDKIGTVSLIGDASLYEVKPIGIKASF